jgi:hypothetical protein
MPEVRNSSLDETGFTLLRWPTAVTDFIDTQAISDRYISECRLLIRQLTGCDDTFSAGPIHCRFDGIDDPKDRYDGKPAHYVHADYSPASVEMAAQILPQSISACSRKAIYNIWRVLTSPPQSRPLAVCDTTSLRPGDAEESKVILSYPDGRDVFFFTQLFYPRPRHRWYYFSNMWPEEVLVFKSFDSDLGRARYVPHCAFVDPTQPNGAARVSVEARIWATFK